MTTCRNCGTGIIGTEDFQLCGRCSALRAWNENRSVDDLGILLFFRKIMPAAFKDFKYGIPLFHREILYEASQDQPEWKKNDRQIVIAAPRGSSKTTLLSKGYALYCALMRKKKYIVLASKTSRSAEKNLRWIRQALGSSRVIQYFGDLRPDIRSNRSATDEVEGIWSKGIIILKNGVTIESIGMGQQMRSAAEGEDVARIDLLIADDTETNENTRTPDSREKNEDWLFETVLPALDIDTGTIIFINTLAHSESILAKLLKSKNWRKKFYQATYRDKSGREVSLWPEKFTKPYLDSERENYALVGRLRSYYKEYYNVIQSETGFSDRWFRYYTGSLFEDGGRKWLRYRIDGSDTEFTAPAYVTVGIDLAFTFTESSDWTVILPLATIHDNRIFILPYVRARMSTYDDRDENGRVERVGLIDEVVRLHASIGGIDQIVIGANAPDIVTVNLLKERFKAEPHPPKIVPFVASRATGDKLQRNKDLLQPQYEIGRMHHLPGMHELEQELVAMGDTTDDICDALFNAVKFAKTPTYLEYSPIMLPRDHEEAMYREQKPPQRNWMVL